MRALTAKCLDALPENGLALISGDGFGAAQFQGEFAGTLEDYLYFSATSYTSLGLGDVYPQSGVRLLTGVEALND